jgi:DedD protein
MDSRAKQRLTGAVILVALFVLLVPELLRGPRGADAPGTGGKEGATSEEGMRRYTIDLDANNPASPPSNSQAAPPVNLPQPESVTPRPASPVTPTPLAQPGEAAAPAGAEPSASSSMPAAATAHPAAAPTAAAATTTQAAVKPTPTPAQSPAPAPRSEPQKPAAVASGSFAVQLGSFSVRDNADRLVRDMTAKGFAAFVSPIKSGGREIFRVRVGPTRDRAQAEALAAQLRRIGQSGAIVPIS